MSEAMNASSVAPGNVRVEMRAEYPATEATIQRLFEIGLVEWVGIEADGALPFLFLREAVYPVCQQRHRWFVLRNEQTMCEACDRARKAAA